MQRTRPAQPVRTALLADRWPPAIFGIVPDGAQRRRPSDLVRLATTGVVVAALVVLADLTGGAQQWWIEQVAGRSFDGNRLLTLLYPGVLTLLAAVVVTAAIWSRRVALVLTVLVAAVVALLAAVVLDALVGDAVRDALRADGVAVPDGLDAFPAMVLTVQVAVVLSATAYLTRPARRLVRPLIGLAALAAVASGDALGVAALAALVLGWGSAAVAHLAVTSPAGTPSLADVHEACERLGVPVTGLHVEADQDWGEVRLGAIDGDGRAVRITVIGRDATDAGLLAKAWRVVWYRDSGPPLTLTRAQQVEHRAFLLLLAERAGVAVPEVVALGVAGESGSALLVTADPTGRSLDECTADSCTDGDLDALWSAVRRLHAAQLAHGDLVGRHLLFTADGDAALRDVDRMSAAAPPERLRIDRAQLLLATGDVVGVDRAVAAADRAIGADGLAELLPLLQPGVLGSRITRSLDQPKELSAALTVAVVETTGAEAVEPAELRRVSPTSLLMAAGAILGVYLLIGQFSQVAGVGDVFAGVRWEWVFVTFLFSQTPQFAQAVAMLGSVAVRLPLGPVTAVQFANNFTGMVGGTVATTALVVRFFQKRGLTVAVAVSSGVLNTLAAMVVQGVLLTIGLVVSAGDFAGPTRTSRDTSEVSGASPWAILAVAVVGLAVAAVILLPRHRAKLVAAIRPQVDAARTNLTDVARNPRKAVQLFGGNLTSQLFFAFTLWAALHAYGASLGVFELIVINSFASLLGGLAPVPGGLGVVEAGLIAGMTAAGIDNTTAMAATFTARACTAYLPPIWGWLCLRWLGRHSYI